MLKETITYTDFDGVERTEDFYFNFTTAELARMELHHNGKLEEHLKRIVSSNDGRQIMNAFEEIIQDSYGVRSEDGKSFLKSKELTAHFVGSEAYSVFFMKIIQDPDFATLFVRGIVPADLAAKAEAAQAQNGFRPGAQTLPQSRIDQLAAQSEAGYAQGLPSEVQEDTQPTPTPELLAAREAELQTQVDGSLPEDPLLPHEAGYAQGLTRRQARELGLL